VLSRRLGSLGEVSIIALGARARPDQGATTLQEAVATYHAAIDAGVTLIDSAPAYGDGLAERVIGEAFLGSLPAGVRLGTKCNLDGVAADQVEATLARSLEGSLGRMRVDHVDYLLLHSRVLADRDAGRFRGVTVSVYRDAIRPALVRLTESGVVGAWGISALGMPDGATAAIEDDPAPAIVECATNLLGSAGAIDEPDVSPRHREIVAAAARRGVGILGVRTLQAGALTTRAPEVPSGHPDLRDFTRAAPFRALAAELDEDPALLAHRYALAVPGVSSIILGVRDRTELAVGLLAAEQGPLAEELVSRIDAVVHAGRSHAPSQDH
jgi:aryl-alcohol dehydrogenase-like predicted oxidoreductase